MASAVARTGLAAAILSPLIWAVHFTVIYVANALACARGIGAGHVPLTIAITTMAAFAGVLYLAWLTWPHAQPREEASEPFANRLGLLLCALVLLALAWNAATAVLVPAC